MATSISIPRLGVSMTEAILTQWQVTDGAEVAQGQVIYILETDKTENEIEAPCDGVLRHLGVEGETYAVGTEIGWIE